MSLEDASQHRIAPPERKPRRRLRKLDAVPRRRRVHRASQQPFKIARVFRLVDEAHVRVPTLVEIMNVPTEVAIGWSGSSWYAKARVNATFFVSL